MREETDVGSCPECGTPRSFTGQLVCQGCFVPFALMASVHAAAEPPPAEAPRADSDAERTRILTVVPGALPGPPRTRRDAPLRSLRLQFPGGRTVEVAPGFTIRLGRDPQLCPAVTFLADRDNLSRIHARVGVETDGTAWIADEDSTNGTYVRGYRLGTNETAPLRPGDTFRLAADVHVSVLP